MAQQNLTLEELQQLHDLLAAFEASQELQDIVVSSPEDLSALGDTMHSINFARNSRPEESHGKSV